MIDRLAAFRMFHWALFAVTALAIAFVRLLPLDLSPGRWPGPDWMLALAFVWVLRRPDYVPALLVATVFLGFDLLYQRPPGLWAALVVAGLEFLRSRALMSRELPFLLEWTMAAVVLAVMTLANRMILALLAVDQPEPGLDFLQFVATILGYPVVVVASAALLGVRKVMPGEVDQLGHRL